MCPPATRARPLSSLHLSLCQLTIHTPGMKVHCAQGVSPSPLPGSSHTYVRQFVLNACTCRKNSSQSLVSSEAGPWMEDEVPCPLMQRRGDMGVRGHREAGPPGREKYRAAPWILPPAALAKIKARDTPFSLPKQVTEFQAALRDLPHTHVLHILHAPGCPRPCPPLTAVIYLSPSCNVSNLSEAWQAPTCTVI